ncbi:hypothetical protein BDZ91DRAFT_801760 [Kalaharituber pfeilii]|nr:hypothetical protein BDZ91DRAFT_801760 [Kalaharituber pfeilii]
MTPHGGKSGLGPVAVTVATVEVRGVVGDEGCLVGRYCAYDPASGSHFIHRLKDNRWYPYYPETFSTSQQQSFQKRSRDFRKTKGDAYAYNYPHHDAYMSGEYDAGYSGMERSRSHTRHRDRNREEFLYSAAAAEAAQRSLIEKSNIDMEYYFEDEGVDVRMAERRNRYRRSQERRRHRSRSAPAYPRDEKIICRDTYLLNNPRQIHQRHRHRFGSNQAGVGVDGSEHDSGYMDDFEPASQPRKAMPGVARWLDEIGSVYSCDDCQHPFDKENFKDFEANEAHAYRSKVRDGGAKDFAADRYQGTRYHVATPRHIDSNYYSQNPYTEIPRRSRDNVHYPVEDKTSHKLHRQDSGIDMSNPMEDQIDIEIDITMDDAGDVADGVACPKSGYFPHHSPSSKYVKPHRVMVSPNAEVQHHETQDGYDCYYVIPPCTSLPPPVDATVATANPGYLTVINENAAQRSAPNSPKSPTYHQADSIYTGSVVGGHSQKFPSSPTMLPRAPSPPLSPPPYAHKTRRSGLGVPIVEDRVTGYLTVAIDWLNGALGVGG